MPDAARERILAQRDHERLERWLESAIVAGSVQSVSLRRQRIDFRTNNRGSSQSSGVPPQSTPQHPPSPPAPSPSPSCVRPTFEGIYKDYLKYVRTVVKRRVPSYDVDDVVQVIFAAIARGLPKYDPALPFRPWLNTIIVRTLTAYFGREATQITAREGLAAMPRGEASSIDEQLGAMEMIPPH